jgi:hypothetical protein
MTTATSADNFEQRLDHIVKAAKAINKRWSAKSFSIEAQPNSSPRAYLSFIESKWSTESSISIQSICDEFGLTYRITPLNDKLVITLS